MPGSAKASVPFATHTFDSPPACKRPQRGGPLARPAQWHAPLTPRATPFHRPCRAVARAAVGAERSGGGVAGPHSLPFRFVSLLAQTNAPPVDVRIPSPSVDRPIEVATGKASRLAVPSVWVVPTYWLHPHGGARSVWVSLGAICGWLVVVVCTKAVVVREAQAAPLL